MNRSSNVKKVEVVAAIIYCEDMILCVQRPENKLAYISKKFEFPGGKIEVGESHIEALSREIQEELNTRILIKDLFLTVVHPYPDFELTMHSYKCKIQDQSDISLNEHISKRWLPISQLKELDWAAADIPIVDKLVING